MKNKFIGREKEQAILREALQSGEAEMVALIGRRRVGKTALVKQAYAEHLDFEMTGVQKAPLAEQLQNFALRLQETFGSPLSAPTPTPTPSASSTALSIWRFCLPPTNRKSPTFAPCDAYPLANKVSETSERATCSTSTKRSTSTVWSTADGRMDAVVQTPNHVYISAFKLDQSPQLALNQIKKKGYAEKYRLSGKTVTGVGIAFESGKKAVAGWKKSVLIP